MIYSTINRGQTVNLTKYSTENTEVIRRIGSDQFLFRFDDIRSIESLNKLHFEFVIRSHFWRLDNSLWIVTCLDKAELYLNKKH